MAHCRTAGVAAEGGPEPVRSLAVGSSTRTIASTLPGSAPTCQVTRVLASHRSAGQARLPGEASFSGVMNPRASRDCGAVGIRKMIEDD
jgi:hypothetical protein